MIAIWRTVRRSPAFALFVVGSVAVGTAAVTVAASAVDQLALRASPFRDADQLVEVLSTESSGVCQQCPSLSTGAALAEWRASTPLLVGLAGYRDTSFALIPDADAAEVPAAVVDRHFFDVLGGEPLAGRLGDAQRPLVGGRRPIVVSAALSRALSTSPGALVGRVIRAGADSFTVVAVMPREWSYPANAAAWVSQHVFTPAAPTAPVFRAVGRLKASASAHALRGALGQSRAGLASASTSTLRPPVATRRSALVSEIAREERATRRQAVLPILVCIAVALLLGLVNIATLFLVRAMGRTHEMATRYALGARHRHVAGALLAEALALSAVGGAVGIGAAAWGWPAVRQALSVPMGGGALLDLNWRVGLVAWLCCLGAGMLCALAPILFARRASFRVLRLGRAADVSARWRHARAAFVILQIGGAATLASISVILIRSYVRVSTASPGYAADQLFVATVQLPDTAAAPDRIGHGPTPEERRERTLRALETIPAVNATTAWNLVRPRLGVAPGTSVIDIEGRRPPLPYGAVPVMSVDVTPSFFTATGIRLVRGRPFASTDTAGDPPVVIVSQLAAQRMWPGMDPLGKRFRLSRDSTEGGWMTVIGVAADAMLLDQLGVEIGVSTRQAWPVMYRPLSQAPSHRITLAVRAHALPDSLSVRAARAVSAHLGATGRIHFASLRDVQLGTPQILRLQQVTRVAYASAGIAVALAILGVVGVLQFTVQLRRREFGIRAALGQSPQSLRRSVFRYALTLLLLGVGIGIPSVVLLQGLTRRLMFSMPFLDVPSLGAVAVGLVLLGLAAAAGPARPAGGGDELVDRGV